MIPDAHTLATLTQFGVAGLVAAMWLVERRASTHRERQITEMHERLLEERRHIDVLLAALNANTRALAALEAGQRELTSLLTRLAA